MKRVIGVAGVMVSLALIGCGEETDADVETAVGAISEPNCMLATADFTQTGGIDPAWPSPRAYDNPRCNKAVVVDIPSYSATYSGPASGGAPADMDGQTKVEWADTLPTTQSACTSAWLTAYLYRWSSTNQEWSQRVVLEAYGQWVMDPWTRLMVCRGPSVSFHTVFTSDLTVGRAYRIAASARTAASSSASTRKLRVQSLRPTVIQ